MANPKKHTLPKGLQTPWAGNPPGKLSGKAKSAVRKAKAKGISPSNPGYGIANTSRKHSSAVSQPRGRNLPSGQGLLSGKAKRQVG